MIKRRQTTQSFVKDTGIGSESPISVQSMTTTKTEDPQATLFQIKELEEAGCDIVRVTVNNRRAVRTLPEILAGAQIPVVADIHFDHRLALEAVEAGIHKIRINPGNIGSEDKVSRVLDACRQAQIPIRIGVNAGSLEKDILEKKGYPTAEGMVESAKRHIDLCEKYRFYDIIVSLKSSHTDMMIEAYRQLAQKVPYPFHLGVTEAGTFFRGSIHSAVGIGTLLAEGIGDTLRVSLTDNPVEEIRVGREILKSLNLARQGVTVVSCPTCGRLEVDLIPIVKEIEAAVVRVPKNIRVAVMGCVVNGPGEAREADIGVACGKGFADLFYKGEKLARVPEEKIVSEVLTEIDKF